MNGSFLHSLIPSFPHFFISLVHSVPLLEL